MRLRKISGTFSELEPFKQWLLQKYSAFEEVHPYFFKTSYGYYHYLADNGAIGDILSIDLKSLNIKKTSYYKISIEKKCLFFFFHNEGSEIPMGKKENCASLAYAIKTNKLELHPQYYIIDNEAVQAKYINPKKRFLLQQINQKLIKEKKTIEDCINKLPFKKQKKEALLNILKTKNNCINYKALSSFFNLYENFNLDLFNQLQNKPTLPYYENLTQHTEIFKNKAMSWLLKLPFLMKNCLLLKEIDALLCFNPEIYPEIAKTRVRNFFQLSALANALVKEHSIIADEELSINFSNQQKKMKSKQKRNFRIPQTIFELRMEAKQMKNCAINYATIVTQKNTFIGFYELNQQNYCLLFDQFLNIIEIAGFKNYKLSDPERMAIAKSLINH